MQSGAPLKILLVLGTRPEGIKLAPVLEELLARPESFEPIVCATGQHREMLDHVLRLFRVKVDHDLNIMTPEQTPSEIASRVLERLPAVLDATQPDWVLVQGDTTTVMAASLAAFYARVRVGHVEAGLRTGNKWSPFPEEANRRVTSCVADLHFAPTQTAKHNLEREGIPSTQIVVTGNTIVDAFRIASGLPFAPERSALRDIRWDRQIITVTAHRRESFGAPLKSICDAIVDLAASEPQALEIVFPVHLNPNVREVVTETLGHVPNIRLLDPLDYRSLVYLISKSKLILTDSGGIQEEALSASVPVLVLRDTTERPEGVEAGGAVLVGTSRNAIRETVDALLHSPDEYERMRRAPNPYGDGFAARRIADAIQRFEQRTSPIYAV